MKLIEIKINGMTPNILNNLLYFVSKNTIQYDYKMFKHKIKFNIWLHNENLDDVKTFKENLESEYKRLYT